MATTTWTQTAGMVSDEDTDNLESFSEQAEASKNAAAASEAAAEASATSASASATSATSSASSASTDAATATTKASEAATSATNAATSETNAATSATNAATSETNAATSATNAATSETNAATSATSAAASAASVGSEASDAAASATAAAASETAAATSETNAATSATNAATSETNAATSATTASTAATNASTSETNAATSETNAATSETNAATSETNAATSATSASTSATNAAASASAASASQVSAAASAASAANSYDLFDDRYLGTKTSDPTVDNDGNALVAGALYFNSSANEMRVYDGANWIAASSAGGASLLEYKYTATSGQTTFSGADDNSNSLSYTQDNLIVTLNGVVLENGTDYTATTGTSVVLASGAATSDELNVIAFKTFTTADMVAASTGGTFYGAVAVTGDLTVDTSTLYVDSTNNNVGIGTSSPVNVSGASDLTVAGKFFTSDGTEANPAHSFTGDQNTGIFRPTTDTFAVTTGGSERMRIDSSGRVGIGTTPTGSWNVQLASSTGSSRIRMQNSTTGTTDSDGGSIAMENNDFVLQNSESGVVKVEMGGSERMRIDSSGNLLVGRTTLSGTDNTQGAYIFNEGALVAQRSSNIALYLNRYGTDGDIALFRKEGTTVGSIGSYSGVGMYAMAPNNGGSGLLFYDNAAPIYPIKNVSGSATIGDAYTDLGAAVHRFKDLYLSGGVYLGGTGSANKLDDYEEGTWTPVMTGSTGSAGTASTTVYGARYTKVGNLVTVMCYIRWSDIGSYSGNAAISGLPFTSANDGVRVAGNINFLKRVELVDAFNYSGNIVPNTSVVEINRIASDLGIKTQAQVSAFNDNLNEIIFSCSYNTA